MIPTSVSLSDLHAQLSLYDRVIQLAEHYEGSEELLYLFGETEENRSSQFEGIMRFLSPIGIIAHEASPGFVGHSVWRKALLDEGVPDARIVPISSALYAPDGQIISNTMTEAIGLMEYVREHGLQHIAIRAPRFHLARCVASAVSAMKKAGLYVRIQPVLGGDLPWNEEAIHSQGRETGKRIDFFSSEPIKSLIYMLKGDLIPPHEVLGYLKQIG